MYENNGKEKKELLIQDKINKKKFKSSIISPNKSINNNYIKTKKSVFQIKKRSNTLHKQNNKSNKMKLSHKSPDEKMKSINIYNLEFFQKNINNKMCKRKKFQKLSNYSNNILNDQKNKEDKKFINRKKNKSKSPKKPNFKIYKFKLSSYKPLSHSLNSKKIKINIKKFGNNERNILKEIKTKLNKESTQKENVITNFSVDEYDESINKKLHYSRKKYSLTNQNILPCIPFFNPFLNNNLIDCNINGHISNITDNKEKKGIYKSIQNNCQKNIKIEKKY